MRYVFTPPDDRHSIMVNGRLIGLGDAFNADEAFAARQPVGWVTPEAEYCQRSAKGVDEVPTGGAAGGVEARFGRLLPGSYEITETEVPAGDPNDPELQELNAVAQAESVVGEPAAGNAPTAKPAAQAQGEGATPTAKPAAARKGKGA